MRGKDLHKMESLVKVRITPAYAGKSTPPTHLFVIKWDHPRVCGEKLSTSIFHMVYMGSPPRMRGKVSASAELILPLRITPAYAGKRLKRSHKIVLFINKPIIFHSVCNRLDITNNNPTVLDAAVLW